MSPAHFRLRTHLLLLLSGTLLPVLGLSAFLVARLAGENRAATERGVVSAARAQAAVVDNEISASIRALLALAQSPRLDSGDLAAFHAEASRVQQTQPSWLTMILLTTDGRQLVNSDRAWGTPLPEAYDPESVVRLVATRTPLVGNLRRGTQFNRRLAFPVRVPVIRDDTVTYVLSAVITPERLAELVSQQERVSEGWTSTIFDGSGVVVARTRDAERYLGTTELRMAQRGAAGIVYRELDADDGGEYVAQAPASLSGWTAAVTVPADAVDGPFRRSIIVFGGLVLLLTGLGAGAAYVVARSVTKGIGAAAHAAEQLASGGSPAAAKSMVTEVHRLMTSLEASATLLHEHRRERDDHLRRVEEARGAAEQANRTKDDFLAMLGHELRNPLAPVVTALHLMRMRAPDAARREREVIERQVRHLARLVDDLLDVSRLRRGKIDLRREQFEASVVIARAVEIADPLIRERGHRITVDVPPDGLPIQGDETRIAQVLANILTNAAKYSERPGHIELAAGAEHGYVVIECRDDGLGIAPELLPRVFDLFAQGEQTLERRQGGLGLGLAVARTLTVLHGGTIQAESGGPGTGSRFTVRLPLAPTGREAVPPSLERVASPAASPGARVLLVDDNRDALDMLVAALELSGYVVATALSGAEALARVQQFDPEIAVLDIGLPGMDGYELARRLRERAHTHPIRLVALTGYGQDQDVAAARAAGFDVHLVKPVTTERLLDAVRGDPASEG